MATGAKRSAVVETFPSNLDSCTRKPVNNESFSPSLDSSTRRSTVVESFPQSCETGRELFEACRGGDLTKVKTLVNSVNVNSRDTAGRKSTPLHFAAGLSLCYACVASETK